MRQHYEKLRCMQYVIRVDVCVVQSRWKRGNFLNNSFAISAIFSNKENFLIIVITGFYIKTILTDIHLKGYALNLDTIVHPQL